MPDLATGRDQAWWANYNFTRRADEGTSTQLEGPPCQCRRVWGRAGHETLAQQRRAACQARLAEAGLLGEGGAGPRLVGEGRAGPRPLGRGYLGRAGPGRGL